LLGTLLSIFITGFLIGGLARWAVPGPDPMPIWLTTAFGLVGSLVGGGVAAALLHADENVSSSDYFTISLASIVASIALVMAYRRVIQKRPITGPEAHRPPTKGWGLRRAQALRTRRKQEVLKRLDELHDQGVLTDEEYLEKRREVLSWE
jgi:uncharacterized membrane protein YeaQ/YmgE (transglycosylase-associated protein family)